MKELTSRQSKYYDLIKYTVEKTGRDEVTLGDLSESSDETFKHHSPTNLVGPMDELAKKGYIEYTRTIPYNSHSFRDMAVIIVEEE